MPRDSETTRGRLRLVTNALSRLAPTLDLNHRLERRRTPRGRIVLIIDDEPAMIRYAGHLLYRAGLEYRSALTLTEAIDLLASPDAGALLLDWRWTSGPPRTTIEAAHEARVPVGIWTVAPHEVATELLGPRDCVLPKKDQAGLAAWLEAIGLLSPADRQAAEARWAMELEADIAIDAEMDTAERLRRMGER